MIANKLSASGGSGGGVQSGDMLLLMNGVEGGTDFPDEYGNYTVTPAASPASTGFVTTTARSVEGSASGKGNASGVDSYLIADSNLFNFGTGDFTISAYVYGFHYTDTANGIHQTVFGQKLPDISGASLFLFLEFDGMKIEIEGTRYTILNRYKLTLEKFFEVSICKEAATNTIRVFVNGELKLSVTSTFVFDSPLEVAIGGQWVHPDIGAISSTGIDRFEVLHGICQHTTSYQPTIDLHFDQVEALLHFDGTVGGTTTSDNSQNSFPVTFIGDAVLAPAPTGMYGQVASMTNGAITVGSSGATIPEFDFGSGDFCIDASVRLDSKPVDDVRFIVDRRNTDSSVTMAILFDTRAITNNIGFRAVIFMGGIYYTFDNGTNAANSININQTYKLRFNRSSGTARFFIDGVAVTNSPAQPPAIPSITNTAGADFRLGRHTNGNFPLDGYIDEFRVTKGDSRGNTNYTPYDEPFRDQ